MKMERRPRADSVEQFLEQQKNNSKDEVQQQHQRRKKSPLRMTTVDETDFLVPLPLLRDAASAPAFQSVLLRQKLRQCQALFNFEDPLEQQIEKEVKTDAMKEVIEFLATGRHIGPMLEDRWIGTELFNVLECNLFRTLPPAGCSSHSGDSDDLLFGGESSVVLEPAWPHLQLSYRLLRLLVDRADTEQLAAYISDSFCSSLLELFHSADPREREQVKHATYALYSQLGDRRAAIRRKMSNMLLEHTFEHVPFNGIDELLQIVGDIVNGFNVPLKQEHRQFLFRVLLPLHRSPRLALFFSRLASCVTLFVEKEAGLSNQVLHSLLLQWPRSWSAKEVLFITEVEQILTRIGSTEFGAVMDRLARQLARCVTSHNSRVAESALLVWNNPKVLELIQPHSQRALPIIFPALYWTCRNHWNDNVKAMVLQTLNSLMMLNGGRMLEELGKKRRKEEDEKENGGGEEERREGGRRNNKNGGAAAAGDVLPAQQLAMV